MIVDDSSVVRMILSQAIKQDPDLELVEAARNGKIAVERVPIVNPDVIILDIEMPELDGFGVLKALKKDLNKIRVIMFSAMSDKGAAKTLEALALGASDYVLKPTASHDIQQVSDEVIKKAKQFFIHAQPQSSAKPVHNKPGLMKPASTRADLIAIGASTGGPVALAKVIPKISGSCKSPILITQHMPPVFTEQLARQLNSASELNVVEAKDGMVIEPGYVYIAPGDYHLVIHPIPGGYKLGLNQEPPENYCRPAVDVMFRSISELYKGHVLAVIMTGMGKDGFLGTQLLKAKRAKIIAQNKDTCVVYGMPSIIVENQLADEVLPLDEIPIRINELCLK